MQRPKARPSARSSCGAKPWPAEVAESTRAAPAVTRAGFSTMQVKDRQSTPTDSIASWTPSANSFAESMVGSPRTENIASRRCCATSANSTRSPVMQEMAFTRLVLLRSTFQWRGWRSSKAGQDDFITSGEGANSIHVSMEF